MFDARIWKEIGYDRVALPRPHISPLQVLVKQKDRAILYGDLTDLINDRNVKLPAISRDNAVPNITAISVGELDIGAGISLLSSFLASLGNSNIDLSAQYSKAKSVEFVFGNVLMDEVLPARVNKFLQKVISFNFDEQLKKTGLYLITSVLKSNLFGTLLKDKNGQTVKLDIDPIKEIISGKVEVKYSSEKKEGISYKGDKYLVFGVQAYLMDQTTGSIIVTLPAGVPVVKMATGRVETSNSVTRRNVRTATFLTLNENECLGSGALLDLRPRS